MYIVELEASLLAATARELGDSRTADGADKGIHRTSLSWARPTTNGRIYTERWPRWVRAPERARCSTRPRENRQCANAASHRSSKSLSTLTRPGSTCSLSGKTPATTRVTGLWRRRTARRSPRSRCVCGFCLRSRRARACSLHSSPSVPQVPAPCAQDGERTPTLPMIEASRVDMYPPDGKARVQVHGRSHPVEQQMEALLLLNRSATQVRRAAVHRALRRTHPPTLSPPSALSPGHSAFHAFGPVGSDGA